MAIKGRILFLVSITTALSSGVAYSGDNDGYYLQTDLVSDGFVSAPTIDAKLKNPWGLTSSATSPWWVANNGTGTSTLYNGAGVKQSLTVDVPGDPTGMAFNGGTGFVLSKGGCSGAARFMWASEDGTLSGWNPSKSTQACVAIDNSKADSVYKGVTLANEHLYLADFHNNAVAVYDSTFAKSPVAGGFADSTVPAGYAPFNVQVLGGHIFVAYAVQKKPDLHDDVAGPGNGIVNEFDLDGNLLCRVATKGVLNSPWGLAMTPDDFGRFSNDLLVGNFGDGRIHAFTRNVNTDDGTKAGSTDHAGDNSCRWTYDGVLKDGNKKDIEIEGLWAIAFGNGASSGVTNALYFTAGSNGEADGLFGKITWVEQH